MKKDKEKATYESPQTTRTTVSLESGICSASADVQNPNDAKTGQIESHEVNTDFDLILLIKLGISNELVNN